VYNRRFTFVSAIPYYYAPAQTDVYMAMDQPPSRPSPAAATAAFVASAEGMYESGPVTRHGFASHDRSDRSAALQAVQVQGSGSLL